MSTFLHVGDVAHVRHTPFRHRFRYRMWMLSCDLDAPVQSLLFRRNRAGLVSLHDADHGPRDGSALRPWVEARLAEAGLGDFAHRIRFMAIPRVLGYAFNPIAFFLCHDETGRLGAVIHQVKNTFGGQTEYVLPVADRPGTIHQSVEKRMHVSPFFDMQGGYRFAFSDPTGAQFKLAILYGTEGRPRMTAIMRLARETLSDLRLAQLLLAMPLMTLGVFAAIHFQALRLYLRGARFHPLPPTAPRAPATTTGASA